MTEAELLVTIRQKAKNVGGRLELSCQAAFALAASCGCAVGEIGKLCNLHGIRISACQLGCFA